jgi:putative MATE family efflux protein
MQHTQTTRSLASGSTKDMTVGSPYSLMIGFALPVLLSQIFQQLYNTADAFIVGRYLGTNALAAVTSSGTLIFLLVSFFTGTAMGAGVVISRYFGAHNQENVSRAIHTVLALGLICGVALTVFGVAATPTLLVWMQTDPEVLPAAIEYFRYYFLGSLALVLYNICRSIMNALGDSRRPLYYLIFSSILNIVLDVLFIAGFHWGVWSAAIATVISQAASVVLCMAYLLRRGNIFTVEVRKIRLHGDMLREIIRNGLPAGVQNSVIALANVIVQSQINSFGALATAAYGTHAKIEGFAFLPITSFTMASTTFVSQNLGAGLYDRARKGARFSIFAAVALAEMIGFVVYAFAPQLIGLFDQTPGVVALGVQQARTAALFYCLLAFSHSIAAICRGAGKAFVPMCIMLAVWCVIRIIYIAIVMRLTGEIGYIYWAYPLTWAISSSIYLVYYLRADWVHGFEQQESKPLHRRAA